MKYEFEHQWGGEDTWYTKGKRWANKQKFPMKYLALGVIEWLRKKWIDGKVEMEMGSIDKQAKSIVKQWEEEDERNRQPEILETGLFGEEGWSISMSNKNIIRGTEQSQSGMGTTGNEAKLEENGKSKMIIPNPWDGDWNDAVINYHIWNKD